MSILSNIFSFATEEASLLRRFKGRVQEINAWEEKMALLSDEAFGQKTQEFKNRLADGDSLDDILPEAFAVVREASKRVLNERHYDVQLIGGQVLHHGAIAEMRTGEGKTLVATLPTYLNALTGEGVHVVTVNDYLSRRDAVWMGQVYAFLGLSVSVINNNASYVYDASHTDKKDDVARDTTGSFKVEYEFLKPCSRKEAYLADITYGTNSEFGFDYLRDNIAYNKEQLNQRGHAFAVVDEVDSILIDEARTPLIISAPSSDSEDLYATCAELAESLRANEHYTVDEKRKQIQLTDEGITEAERLLGIENMYTERGIKFVYHIETAVKAKALFQKDKEYVVRDGEVVIVDEFTGRLQPGRRWSEGIHQAVEAKEKVSVQKESKTLASITYQNYFRFYKKLSGMTGTAETSKEEFEKVYNVSVVRIPTHRKIQRIDKPDLIYQTEKGKIQAIVAKVKEVTATGQPVLIGTTSIEKNELLALHLQKAGIAFQMLNAKNHEKEGEVIAQAGQKGSVFLATNMAGRGVDIKLGGLPRDPVKEQEIKDLGGLYVIGTERHEARRIDNQLRGRSGRQGDPGETQFFVSLEDHLMRIFSPDTMKRAMGMAGLQESEAIQSKLISHSIESAQKKIEGFHFDARQQVLKFDDVLNQQRTAIYERRRKILLGETEAIDAFIETCPLTDNDKELVHNLTSQQETKDAYYRVMKTLILQTLDTLWMNHLEAMEYTRTAVGLRQIGQRDPYVEYKREGLQQFRAMEESLRSQIAQYVPQLPTIIEQVAAQEIRVAPQRTIESVSGEEVGSASQSKAVIGKMPDRNAPCPCGNGKKWKKCGELHPESCDWVKSQMS